MELAEEYSEHKEYLNAIYDNLKNIGDTENTLENGFSGYESFEQYANERADEGLQQRNWMKLYWRNILIMKNTAATWRTAMTFTNTQANQSFYSP